MSSTSAITPISQSPRDHAFLNNPYPFYAERHADTARFIWSDYGHWCFGAFDDLQTVFRDRRFGVRPGLPEPKPEIERWYETERFSLLALDPPEHTQMRGLVNRAFLSRRVEQLRPRIEQLATELIVGFADGDGTELQANYSAPLPAIVIAEMIGLPREMAPQLLDWSNEMVKMYTFRRDEHIEAAADLAAAEFSDYLRGVLAERRQHPTDDLITHMLHVEIDGERLDEAEVIATTILLLNAGHEATVHTTGNAVKTILDYAADTGIRPIDLFKTPEQASATVEECLRFDAPLHLFTRYALEDLDFDGIEFAAGDEVGLLLGCANRDPLRFEHPDRFDPYRTDDGNISFGFGIHFCIGAPLARIELQSSLRLLFERFPNLAVEGTPEYRDIFHFHGLDELQVRW